MAAQPVAESVISDEEPFAEVSQEETGKVVAATDIPEEVKDALNIFGGDLMA